MRLDSQDREQVSLQMTPMIDIVFQLLVFFIMTFKIIAAEGDFHVKMPRGEGGGLTEMLPLRVHLSADESGQLAQIRFGDRPLRDFDALRAEVIRVAGRREGQRPAAQQDMEVVLECDERLHYRNVVAAITAVTGYPDGAGRVVPLVKRISFAGRRR